MGFPFGKGCIVTFVENVNSSLNLEKVFCRVNYSPSSFLFCGTSVLATKTESSLICSAYCLPSEHNGELGTCIVSYNL